MSKQAITLHKLADGYVRRPSLKIRPVDPYLTADGKEKISTKSLVARLDMDPESTSERLARMVRFPALSDGYDDYDLDDDTLENDDVAPTRYEQRVRAVFQKIDEHKKAHSEALQKAKVEAATPPPETKPNEA